MNEMNKMKFLLLKGIPLMGNFHFPVIPVQSENKMKFQLFLFKFEILIGSSVLFICFQGFFTNFMGIRSLRISA